MPGAIFAVVLIAIFVGIKAQTRAQPGPAGEGPALAAYLALEEMMHAADKSGARRLLSLQFRFIDATGKIHTRKEFLGSLKGTATAPASDVKVRGYGSLATVTGYRKAANGVDVFFLDVFARQKGTWRVLVMQDVALGTADAAPPVPAVETKPHDCKNPCQVLPYRVRSAAEQDVINAFQTILKAMVAHDAGKWARHVADEFVLYDSGRAPSPKSERIAAIERQKENDSPVSVAEVQSVRVSVYGNGAVMTASQGVAGDAHPAYRATRVFVKRNGAWQMAISAHTDAK